MDSYTPEHLKKLSLEDLTYIKSLVDDELKIRNSVNAIVERLKIQFLNTMAYVVLNDDKSVASFHSKLEATKDENIRPYAICYTSGFKGVFGKEFCVCVKDDVLGVRLLRNFVRHIAEVNFAERSVNYNFKLSDVEGASKRLGTLIQLPRFVFKHNDTYLPSLDENQYYYQVIVSDEKGLFPGHNRFSGQQLGQAYLYRNNS